MSKIMTYRLCNGGIEAEINPFGARLMRLLVPDSDGNLADVVLGYNTTQEYIDDNAERYFGAVCGRYANRIAKGKFSIDGVEYSLPINNNGQSLHGGIAGYTRVMWDVVESSDTAILFKYVSPDGQEGFPGTLTILMSYELTVQGEFVVKYSATTDATTVVNLTHHTYFNLAGEGEGDVNGHIVEINADRYVPIDEVSIPTGELASVAGTPFDFREPKSVGRDINMEHEQLKMGSGYDHSWVINGEGLRLAARVTEPKSGRCMEVYTDQVGMQFYSGNFLDGNTVSKSGKGKYVKRGALALETQLLPDSPNQPNFPSARLEPAQEYTHTCIYKFSIKK